MSDVSARVLTAVQEASQLLSKQLMRHGVCEILVQVHTSMNHLSDVSVYGVSATKPCCHLQQDVMRSASAWLPDAGTAALRELLVPTKHVIGNRLDKQQQIPGLHQLTGKLATCTCAHSCCCTCSCAFIHAHSSGASAKHSGFPCDSMASDALLTYCCVCCRADSQLDAAFGTLRMLNRRLAALSCMAHEPSSCSSTPCISVNAQVWCQHWHMP